MPCASAIKVPIKERRDLAESLLDLRHTIVLAELRVRLTLEDLERRLDPRPSERPVHARSVTSANGRRANFRSWRILVA